MKKLLVLATGGTIACADKGNGLSPQLTVNDLIENISSTGCECAIVGRTIMNIDSSNMTPGCWLQIANEIVREHNNFDGFVVTHGTDTMAYTAAALTYLLGGLEKPVVLTGSQYSISDRKTDATQNLNDALLFALEELAGVFLVFDGKVINGTRGIKTKTRSYDAFESINYPPVATIKHNRIQYDESVRPTFAVTGASDKGGTPMVAAGGFEEKLLVIKMFPGLDPGIFDYVRDNFKGVIIESFGLGGLATDSLDLATKIRELTQAGVVVAVTTQCLEEGVDLHVYEVGRKLPLESIIYGRDMNTEALVPKLMWAMGKAETFEEIKALVETPVQDDMLVHT